ncbi:hypothetical protein [Sphingomonas crocodyli]|uniref:DUF559 domain-containing protein n=1 Tax=Sphingomonas crocodyli TaxID=1979270 RepID=A0A437M703_9SPHN|nr:hypothetical protein [Sphingomonas crocodyli]RVT93442.1 hypothetical protein EOD43_06080 [Sphingomonas crocodyli]
MIANRPSHLLADPTYSIRPALPYRVDWSPVPAFVRRSIFELGGIQPITKSMVTAAGGTLHDTPSEGEVALFREANIEFQMIFIVASLVAKAGEGEGFGTTPFALSLLPASKRGEIQTAPIDLVEKLTLAYDPANPPLYARFDPFEGSYGLFGINTPGLAGGKGHLDELGLVIGQFWLATSFDHDEVLQPDIGLPPGDAWRRYAKNRQKLLFTPFKKLEPRRIWGADSPIELFLLQELARRGHHPQLQMLIMENGGTYPSFYNLWGDLDFRYSHAAVTEADLYFPEQRIAVFCDGGRFHSGGKKKKDEAISEKLRGFGITPVRIDGRTIVNDLAGAANRVEAALAGSDAQ